MDFVVIKCCVYGVACLFQGLRLASLSRGRCLMNEWEIHSPGYRLGGLENGWVGTVWFLLTVFVCACQSSCLEPSSSLYVLGFDCDVDGLLKYSINGQWKMFGDWLRTTKQHSLLHSWSGFIDIKSLHPHWNTAVICFYGFPEAIETWNHFQREQTHAALKL